MLWFLCVYCVPIIELHKIYNDNARHTSHTKISFVNRLKANTISSHFIHLFLSIFRCPRLKFYSFFSLSPYEFDKATVLGEQEKVIELIFLLFRMPLKIVQSCSHTNICVNLLNRVLLFIFPSFFSMFASCLFFSFYVWSFAISVFAIVLFLLL